MVPKTIENTREADETVCRPDDEEVKFFFFWIFLHVCMFPSSQFSVNLKFCSCLRTSMLMSLILS